MRRKPVLDIQRYLLISATFWTFAILLSFGWGSYQNRSSLRELALNQANLSLDKDMIYRRWATMHGGVYVPVTEQTPPNPYLKSIPERDITTPSGRKLTLMNPAYMTRQVFEVGKDNYGLRGHITSLTPLRPENEPDDWERSILTTFQQTQKHVVSSVELLNGQPYLRYMRALSTEQGCLKCHAFQGYKLDDIRGGISVSVPLAPFISQEQQQLKTNAIGHGLIWLLGICFIQLMRRRLTSSLQREESSANALESARTQLYQQEKMASIGQLAAGVAHEINNPMGFITSNMSTLQKYITRITEYLRAVDQVIAESAVPLKEEITSLRLRLKLDYIVDDTKQLIEESLDGASRVKNIVDDLKNLSRADQMEMVQADINKILETALNISCNEIKYVADIVRKLGDVPMILCHPQQISQVFINLLTNAGQAIEGHGTITIRSWNDDDAVCISVSDSGKGIPENIIGQIFDPFFTTKDVGKGTGLGLSISYDIIKKHNGEITVESDVGRGTTFVVRLPVALVEPPV
jgi:signal transduction histidine kinase